MKKTKTLLVGNYYVNDIAKQFSDNIVVQNMLVGVSPFTLCADPDTKTIDEWEPRISDINTWKEKPSDGLYEKQRRALFDIRKNFNDFLSGDKAEYNNNTTYSPIGKEVQYKNDAEYIIIDNSAIVYSVFSYKNSIYTNNYSASPFTARLKEQHIWNFSFADHNEMDWKFFFDKFIDTILERYNGSSIILLKTQCSRFYYDPKNKQIKFFDKYNKNLQLFIESVDNYFAEKTGCIVIDCLKSAIPNGNTPCYLPYGVGLGMAINRAARQVEKNIFYPAPASRQNKKHFNTSLAQCLYNRLRNNLYEKFSSTIEFIETNRMSLAKFLLSKNHPYQDGAEVIAKLKMFLQNDCSVSLCDYIVSLFTEDFTALNSQPDYSLIALYTEYFVCDLNDILAINYLSELTDSDVYFKLFAKNICSQADCLPIRISKEFIKNNIDYLKKYSYISKEILDRDLCKNKKYLQICDAGFLVIDCDSEKPFSLVTDVVKSDFSLSDNMTEDFVCTIDYAEALTYNHKYYVEKARKGYGSKPTFLKFETVEDFAESLMYIDYPDLLENENFVIGVDGKMPEYSKFKPIVDLTELLDPYLVTVQISSGLGDQICRYLTGQIIEDFSNRKVIYDDISVPANFFQFGGNKIAKKPIRILSDILSQHLRKDRDMLNSLYLKIYDNYLYVTTNIAWYNNRKTNMPLLLSRINPCYVLKNKIQYTYYNCLIRIESLMENYQFNINDYIAFPPFESEEHIKLSSRMLSCDSVVVHIRRGDYVSYGWDTDSDFYVEAIEKVMTMTQYPNKKFFVFSDDIQWCKEHQSEIGLDKIQGCELFFVDGCKSEETFRDIQLMSLGKIMIKGGSYFPQTAAWCSRNLEIYISSNTWFTNSILKYKIKNENSIGDLSKNYEIDYHAPLVPKAANSDSPAKK